MIFIFSVNFSGILHAFVLSFIYFLVAAENFIFFAAFACQISKQEYSQNSTHFHFIHSPLFVCFPIIGLSFLSSTKMTSRSRAKFICSKSQAFPPTENIFRSEGFELQPFSRKSRVLHSRTRLLLRSLLFGWGYVPFTQIRRTTKYLFMIVLPVCMYV